MDRRIRSLHEENPPIIEVLYRDGGDLIDGTQLEAFEYHRREASEFCVAIAVENLIVKAGPTQQVWWIEGRVCEGLQDEYEPILEQMAVSMLESLGF